MDPDKFKLWKRAYLELITVRMSMDAIAEEVGADLTNREDFEIVVQLHKERKEKQSLSSI